MTPVAVVGGVYQTGLNLMRNLIQKGVRAEGVDCDLTHEGFRSRYGKSHACPNPDVEPQKWVDFMQKLSRDLQQETKQKPVFICSADQWVSALGTHEAALRDYYTFSPGAKIQWALTNKDDQYALADKYDFPRPLTHQIRSRADIEDFIARAHFPCLLKPLTAREWDDLPEVNILRGNKVITSQTPDEFRSHYELTAPYRPNVVAQEIIQGPDTGKYCYFGVYASDGSLLSNAVVQEFRTHPKFFGVPTVARPVVEPDIQSLCDRFFKAIGYVGICEIELKRDTRDGLIKLIEVNPRFTGCGDSASYMGVETGWLHYLDLIGQKPQPTAATNFDFYHIALKIDFMAWPSYLSGGHLSWSEVLAPYKGKRKYYDLDWSDRRLAANTIMKCARFTAGGLLRHLRKK